MKGLQKKEQCFVHGEQNAVQWFKQTDNWKGRKEQRYQQVPVCTMVHSTACHKLELTGVLLPAKLFFKLQNRDWRLVWGWHCWNWITEYQLNIQRTERSQFKPTQSNYRADCRGPTEKQVSKIFTSQLEVLLLYNSDWGGSKGICCNVTLWGLNGRLNHSVIVLLGPKQNVNKTYGFWKIPFYLC